jgi:hypothetical protein
MSRFKTLLLCLCSIILAILGTSLYYKGEVNYYKSEYSEKANDCKDLFRISLSTMSYAYALQEAYNNLLWNRNTPSFRDKEYHNDCLNKYEVWIDDLNTYHWIKLNEKYSKK